MLYTTRWVASECRLEAKFEYVILFLVPDYRSRHVIYLKLYCSFPSNGHSFCPHRSATTSSFLFLSLKPRLTFFHLFLPTSMPSLFWCGCCRAAEAVIVDTRQGIGEGGPRARRFVSRRSGTAVSRLSGGIATGTASGTSRTTVPSLRTPVSWTATAMGWATPAILTRSLRR